jgi:Fe-S cluster biosynthesis and repair protein YggX
MNDQIERTVQCLKLNKELPGLPKPPFPGPLGKKIFENISAEAWAMWRDDMQIKVLNEYRLSMSDPAAHQVLLKQMKLFLNLESGEAVAEVGDPLKGGKVG